MYTDLKSKLKLYRENIQNKPVEISKKGFDIQDISAGTVISEDIGTYYMIENRYPVSYLYGGYPLGIITQQDITLALKVCGIGDYSLHIKDLIFLDTETTGLSGGTGTVAFLIGVGFFQEDEFVLRQYFVRDYDEEYPVLLSLEKLLSSYRGLVTFNGKAFDWNLLQSRFISNRIRPSMKNPFQIDLLYPSRMLWKLKLESCRLSSLEENILGEYRVDDIPGAMIPAAYFKYLEDRNAHDMKKVIVHNEKDILSMVSLMVKINDILLHPLHAENGSFEVLGAGRIFEKFGDEKEAISCYQKCCRSVNPLVRELSLKKMALIYKKNHEYIKSIECYKKLLSIGNSPSIPILIELSKLYEHRIKDIQNAIKTVQEAMDICIGTSFLRKAYFGELKTRLERLCKKARSTNTSAV